MGGFTVGKDGGFTVGGGGRIVGGSGGGGVMVGILVLGL